MAETAAPRTLADQLRRWPDEALARLLTARPDLATPTPQDSTQLASRAGSRASVVRAADQLDALELTVVDAVVALGGSTSLASLQEHVNASPESVASAVDRLTAVALLWGTPDLLRGLSVLSDVVGTTVSGLGPSAETLLASYGPNRVTALARDLGLTPTGERQTDIALVAEHLADRKLVAALVEEVDDQARAILDHLERESRDGSTEAGGRQATRAEASEPVDQLLSRGLLMARGPRHVSVPREVAMALRGGTTTRVRADHVPDLATSERD